MWIRSMCVTLYVRPWFVCVHDLWSCPWLVSIMCPWFICESPWFVCNMIRTSMNSVVSCPWFLCMCMIYARVWFMCIIYPWLMCACAWSSGHVCPWFLCVSVNMCVTSCVCPRFCVYHGSCVSWFVRVFLILCPGLVCKQDQKPNRNGNMPYKGVVDCAGGILRKEGPLAFWTGFTAYYGRCAPHAMIILLSIESITSAYRAAFKLD